MRVIRRTFFNRDPALVAQELLGLLLVRESPEGITVGRIVETEAYLSKGDPGSHSFAKRTRKNESMFGPPGHAYVYPIHAKHCFNTVTQAPSIGSAVLIRAVEPTEGIELMCARRGKNIVFDLARGPARLCQAFAIDRSFDGCDLSSGEALYIARPRSKARNLSILRTTRIGLSRGQELPLRFLVADNRFVSGRRGNASIQSAGRVIENDHG